MENWNNWKSWLFATVLAIVASCMLAVDPNFWAVVTAGAAVFVISLCFSDYFSSSR